MNFIVFDLIVKVLGKPFDIFTERCNGDVCEHTLPGRTSGFNENLAAIRTVTLDEVHTNRYDYIIVGGGGGGCPIARTLDYMNQILLIERGRTRSHHILTHDIWGSGLVMADPQVNQLVLTPTGVRTHIGSVLGGGTTTGMAIAIEEQPEYLNLLSQISALPIDRNLFYNSSTWITKRLTQPMPEIEPYASDWKKALQMQGYRDDAGTSIRLKVNATWNGYSLFNAEDDFFRKSADTLLASTAYPQPPNLDILTGVNVDRVTFKKTTNGRNRATCVTARLSRKSDFSTLGGLYGKSELTMEKSMKSLKSEKSYFADKTVTHKLCASREIILSAGAVYTPLILARSGISNSDQLKALSITNPILVNEHIGNNLIDRALLPVAYFRKGDSNVTHSFAPQVCGRVGFAQLGRGMGDATINGNSSEWSFVGVEEMTGGRIVEGFIYATRIFATPKARSSVFLDALVMIMNYCSETKRKNLVCDGLRKMPKCLRKLSATWYFVNEPKSRGYVFMDSRGNVVVDPKYYTAEQDIIDGLRGLINLIQIAKSGRMNDVMETSKSVDFCPATIFETFSVALETVYDWATAAKNELRGSAAQFDMSKFQADLVADRIKAHLKGQKQLKRRMSLPPEYDAWPSHSFMIPNLVDTNVTYTSTFPALLPDPSNSYSMLRYIRDMMQSMWHLAGTAALGTVVDEKLRVKDVDGLAIVDASVLPQVSRMNPTQTVLTLSRYAGILRLQEAF